MTVAAAGEVVEYYALDAVGSVRVVFDPAGTVVARADYMPFGENLDHTAGLPADRFTGQERDPEVGQDYFGARYYAARLGRFASVDPVFAGALENPQRWNRYAYALNNPLVFVDPDGLFSSSGSCEEGNGVFCSGVDMHPPAEYPPFPLLWFTPLPTNGGVDGEPLPRPGAEPPQRTVIIAQDPDSVDPTDVLMVTPLAPAAAVTKIIPKAPEVLAQLRALLRSIFSGGKSVNPFRAVESARFYSARELIRRAQEPGPSHNFPESFNQQLFQQGTRTVTRDLYNVAKPGLTNDAVMYRLPGTVNGVNGTFELGVRPSVSGNTGLIMHRFFRPNP